MDNFSSAVNLIIQDEVNGYPRHETALIVGITPKYLIDAGFPFLKICISGKVISKAYFDHGISLSMLKRLPDIINSPVAVYRPENPVRTDTVVVMTSEIKQESPVIIPIRKEQKIGRSDRFNLIVSIYAKEGPDPGLKWQRKGLLIKNLTG